MPKQKTPKSLKRRIYITGSGKVMHGKIGGSHLRRKKAKRTKRVYGQKLELHPSDRRRMKKVTGLKL